MKNYFKVLLSWLLEGYNDHESWDEWLESQNEIAKSCQNCRFKNHEWYRCWVGTYWAGKGQNRICYNGELWMSKVSDKTKKLTKKSV